MITPAVLMSACGTLILSTSVRLGRVVDRVRALSDKFEEPGSEEVNPDVFDERRRVTLLQFDKLTSRARLLQRTLSVFYVALGTFVLTSVAIGLVGVTGAPQEWIPVLPGLAGACLLLYGSALLILEARLAVQTTRVEMDFLWRLSQRHAGMADPRPAAAYREGAAKGAAKGVP
ncbi:MAG: DUF2721 domain-containing protein [Gemmatimonadetes bacterium]|nr:DUF2721 domain-containing protein [Gemmatimonadota bacterium]